MPITTDRVVAHGVDCRRVTGDRWAYTSLAPWPQAAGGLRVLVAGQSAFAQVGARLDPPGEVLEQVRALIAARSDGRPITLTSGLTAVTAVELVVTAGEAHTVATSQGSGYPPWTAAFSLQPTGADLAAFEAAARGEAGHVRLTYLADTGGTAVAIGADLADWAEPGPTRPTTPLEEQPC
jgi:hypothetical protein